MPSISLSPVILLTLALACLRLALLTARDEGPGDMFARLRYALGVRHYEASQPIGTNWLAAGLLCLWCNSLWWGVILVTGYYLWPVPVFWLSFPLALSAAVILLSKGL